MLDLKELRQDLAAMKAEKSSNIRDFDALSGINFGKIQRFESGIQPRLAIEDIAKWLTACDSSIIIYLCEVCMLKDLEKDLEVVKGDIEILALIKRAIKSPTKKKLLRSYLDGLFADDELPAKNKRPSSLKHDVRANDRSEE